MGKASTVTKTRRRDLLLWLYHGRCFWCGERIDPTLAPAQKMAVSVDELKPRSRGGFKVLENQVPAHTICNMKRGNVIAGSEAFERHKQTLVEVGIWVERG